MMRPGVGIGVLVKKDGKILIQKRIGAHGAETWSLPGGHMEYGETPEQTAIREVKEEVNLTVQNPKIVGITNDFMPEYGKHYITIFLEVECNTGDVHINEPTKTTDIQWCTLDTIPEPQFIPLKNFLENKRLL